eukprot:scaffold26677_cov59-Phaeocystis_antarctica.AAC.3
MPQTMYWSQTESSKWSLDSLSHDLGHPFIVLCSTPTAQVSRAGPRLDCGITYRRACGHALMCTAHHNTKHRSYQPSRACAYALPPQPADERELIIRCPLDGPGRGAAG